MSSNINHEIAHTSPRLLPPLAYRAIRRFLDIVGAIVVLLICLPIMLFTIMLLRLCYGRPIFFIQERLGIHGSRFRVFKFNSMYRDGDLILARAKIELEETPNLKILRNPGVTPIGRILRKTSIDELPQLINVIRGEMSLVGPRPKLPVEYVRYGPYIEIVLQVKPGLTGLWQVNGRCDTTYEQRIMYDVQYATTYSFWLDFWILLLTIPAIISMKGAY